MKLPALVLSALVLAAPESFATLKDSANKRIVGGADAGIGQWPWMVSVHYAGGGSAFQSQFCGASLIADKWVLTAAHCIDGMTNDDADGIEVRIGGYDLDDEASSGQRRSVKRILKHSRYDSYTTDQDLALLELESVSNRSLIAVIDDIDMQAVVPGTDLTVIGWGQLGEDDYNYPNILQEVSIPFVSASICNASRTGSWGPITDNMFCAGPVAGGKDSCYGDSGGPLMVEQGGNWLQVGVVSWGVECAGNDQYGVYTKLSNYGDWLSQHQGHLSQDTVASAGYLPIGFTINKTVKIYNNSNQPQTVTEQKLKNKVGVTAQLQDNQCLNQALAANKHCTVDVAIKAKTAGPVSLTLSSDATGRIGLMETVVVGEVLKAISFTHSISSADISFYTRDNKKAAWRDGATAAQIRSGKMNDADNSPLQTLLTGPATISFEWSLSEKLDDVVVLSLDGVEQDVKSPKADIWKTVTLDIPKGEHRLTWLMQKGWEDPIPDRYLMLRNVKLSNEAKADSGSGGGGGSMGYLSLLLLLPLIGRKRCQ